MNYTNLDALLDCLEVERELRLSEYEILQVEDTWPCLVVAVIV